MLVAQTSGIKEVIVAVNKMDLTEPSYSEERFSEIRTEMTLCLKKMGYQQTDLIFVPISAWRGENLVDPSKKMPWFKGHPFRQHTCFTLLEALDSLTSRDRTGMST